MKDKKMSYVIASLLVILILGNIVYIFMRESVHVSNEETEDAIEDTILLRYGDNIQDISCNPLNGSEVSLVNESGYSVIFYIDPYCESCLKSFALANQMNDILGKFLDVTIVWRQEPSKDIISKIGINEDQQFILDNIGIANPYPEYFVIDNKGEIVLLVDELGKLSKNIVDLDCFTDDEIVESANQYFAGKAPKDSDKPILVYFAMEGCKDCAEAEELLNSRNVKDYYDIITVYTEDSYGEQEYADIGRIFLEIYGIEWYPSFAILKDDTYQFIGETSMEELEGLLFTNISD